MRNAVGIFGAICGAIVIWTVASYGYASADEGAKLNMMFLFGVIAAGGLFGHAVAVRLWKTNRAWSIAIGLTCGIALIVNLSNSLGALAGRDSRATAETTNKTANRTADEKELKRLEGRVGLLGKFTATDQVAVDAAKLASTTAANRRKAECGEYNEKRGPNCKVREDDEAKVVDALAKATAAKATTDTAAKLEADMKPIRDRLRTTGPIQQTNVQGSALAKLFRLPDAEAGFAAVLQNFLLAAVVEALIVLSIVAFELMAPDMSSKSTGSENVATKPENADVSSTKSVVLGPPPKPRLVASQEDKPLSIIEFAGETVRQTRRRADLLEFSDFYWAYYRRCKTAARRALTPQEAVEPINRLCRECGIDVKVQGDRRYLVGVQLVEQAGGLTLGE